MAFTSIVIVIVFVYVFGYAGMIIFDLFFKKDPVEFMPKPKDVDIDISDEAGQFKPIAVGNDEPKTQPVMNGMPKVTRTAETDTDSHSITEEKMKAIANASKSAKDGSEMMGNIEVSFMPSPTTPSETILGSESKASPSDRKPTDDIEPRPTDAETQKRIRELVRIKRQEILAEEMAVASAVQDEQNRNKSETVENTAEEKRGKDSENLKSEVLKEATDVKPSDPDVRIVEPEQSLQESDKLSSVLSMTARINDFWKSKADTEAHSRKERTNQVEHAESAKDSEPSKAAKPAKAPRLPKPPKQPEFHSDAYFDILKVQIDDSKQQTKLQGAQTAEQVSKEAKQLSLDEVQMTLRQINNLWEKKEAKYVPDEDELLAIKKSEELSREAPPQFNI